MFRYFLIFLCCLGFSSCGDSSNDGIVEKSFDITKGAEMGVSAIRSLAFEAKSWRDKQDAAERGGRQGVRTTGGAIPAAATFANREEELEFYSEYIFRHLEYPLQEDSRFRFSLKSESEAVIRQREEALEKFEQLLKRWRRTREERFRDMLDGV